ncbi:MAG: hypothetical protein V1874_09355 [Spirochaetota bacterium]
MAKIELHPDFKDLLKLLISHEVKYLLVGGYAVGYYGYPRATGDMDIWIEVSASNADKVASVLRDFGMPPEAISNDLFLQKDKIIRMGEPPVRIEIITGASGVDFKKCYSSKELADIDGTPVYFISLRDLKKNKKAAGRHKDLEDLEHLP